MLARTGPRLIRVAAAAACLAAASPVSAQDRQPADANPDGAAIKAFLDRVNTYVDLQKKVDDGLPKLSGDEDPSKIEAHQAAMAARMKLARPTAKPGDIFGDAGPLIRGVIREDARLRSLRDARAAMEEVPKYGPPRVNTAYPEKAPRATVPPLILDALPRLPEGLEYRFMGNDLILRDTKANLVADLLNEAVPAPARK